VVQKKINRGLCFKLWVSANVRRERFGARENENYLRLDKRICREEQSETKMRLRKSQRRIRRKQRKAEEWGGHA
jgi:hypothetical protein